jgi:ABC-type dipeptide/oligopeptide/nickel transport system permease subunit
MLTVTGAVVANGFIAAFQGSRPDLRLNWGTLVYNAFFCTALNPRFPWPTLVARSTALSLFAAAFHMVARGAQEVADPRRRFRTAAGRGPAAG